MWNYYDTDLNDLEIAHEAMLDEMYADRLAADTAIADSLVQQGEMEGPA